MASFSVKDSSGFDLIKVSKITKTLFFDPELGLAPDLFVRVFFTKLDLGQTASAKMSVLTVG